MEIRAFKPEDQERIVEITRDSWEKVTLYKLIEDRHGCVDGKSWREKKTADIVRALKAAPEKWLVAVIDERLVGYASFDEWPAEQTGIILDNAVDPACQGRGIATAMNKHILDRFRTKGLRIARVSTLTHDLAARRVYEKNGFQELAQSIHFTLEL